MIERRRQRQTGVKRSFEREIENKIRKRIEVCSKILVASAKKKKKCERVRDKMEGGKKHHVSDCQYVS